MTTAVTQEFRLGDEEGSEDKAESSADFLKVALKQFTDVLGGTKANESDDTAVFGLTVEEWRLNLSYRKDSGKDLEEKVESSSTHGSVREL